MKHIKPLLFSLIVIIIISVLFPFISKFYFPQPISKAPNTNHSINAPIKKGPAITLWFDDAWLSQYTVAFPLLMQYNLVGAIAVPTDYIEFEGVADFLNYRVTRADFMTWDQLHEVENNNWEITSHTKSHHCNLDFYTPKVLKDEFLGAKTILLRKGFKVSNFAMPCGTWAITEPFLPEEARKYYKSYRSLQPEINPIPLINAYDIKAYFVKNETTLSDIEHWIELAKENKSWLIITFHLIDETHQKYSVTPVLFEKIIKLIKQSDIPVVLPKQVILNDSQSQDEKKLVRGKYAS